MKRRSPDYLEDRLKDEGHAPDRWGLLHAGLIWLYRGPIAEIGRGLRTESHNLAAWYFVQGDGYIEAEGNRVRAQAGQWLIVKAAPRFQHFSSDAEIVSIRFRAQWPDGEHLFHEGLSRCLSDSDHPRLLITARRLETAVRKWTQQSFRDLSLRQHPIGFAAYVRIEQRFLDWLLEFYEALVAEGLKPNLLEVEDGRTRQAIQMLRRWPLDKSYSEDEFAEKMGMSRRQLERIIIGALGITAKRYVDQRKLQFARDQIGSGMLSVKEAAFQTGFRHVPSFCRWFRKSTGHPPSSKLQQ